MRHTKKVLKATFGTPKEGIKYLKRLRKKDKNAPVLFIYSDKTHNTTDFIKWLQHMVDDSIMVTEEDFIAKEGVYDERIIFIDNVERFSVALSKAVLRNDKVKNKKIVIALDNRPKQLDFVFDPNMIISAIRGFNLETAMSEFPKFEKKLV